MLQLDDAQERAVRVSGAHCSVVAPAGSGKTRVLVERIAWAAQRGAVRPEHTVVLTFARKAAAELRERLIKRRLDAVEVRTFHAWALGLLRRMHTAPARLIHDVERTTLMRRILVGLAHETHYRRLLSDVLPQLNWSLPYAAREMLGTIASLRAFGVLPDAVARGCAEGAHAWPLTPVMLELWRRYQNVLTRHGAADFADLVPRATQYLPQVVRRAYDHVLVDEAQDANPQEHQLLRAITQQGTALTLVGDPNQALYAWRGAAGSLEQLSGTHATTVQLTTNYRSSDTIVSYVNHFIGRHATDAALMHAHRTSGRRVTIVRHPRYQETPVITRILEQAQAQGFAPRRDCIVLGRTHAALDRLGKVRSRTRCMTVHAAKGLEASIVIIMDASQGRTGFPQPVRPAASDVLRVHTAYDRAAEECRIFYVAMTRARDHLIILTPDAASSPYTRRLPRRYSRRVTLDT